MSNHSNQHFLEKLLNGADVEWKPLGEILNRTKGTKITAGQMKNLHKDGAPIKIFAGGKTFALVNFGDIPSKDVNQEPSIIVKSRGIIEFEYYSKPFTHKNEMWSYYSNDKWKNIKYIFYLLKANENYFQYLGKNRQMPQIAIPDTDRFLIPIPCPDDPEKSLAIQGEIVRILDRFSELTTELNARKTQYKYYRDKLLTFEDDDDVEYTPLGDVAEYSKTRIKSNQLDQFNYIGVDNLLQDRKGKVESNYVPTSGNMTEYRKGDILVGNIRPYLKKIWLADQKGGANADVLVIRPTDAVIDPSYLYQVLADDTFFSYSMKHSKGAKMPRGSKPQILLYPIPIPIPHHRSKSLAEQRRIAIILDTFETLTTSLTEGLPREIALRQKQYAYYRDQLLNFPKPDTKVAEDHPGIVDGVRHHPTINRKKGDSWGASIPLTTHAFHGNMRKSK